MKDDIGCVVSCTASLYRWISLTRCLPPPGYSDTATLQNALQRAPSAFFLLHCCFFPRMVSYSSLRYSLRNPSSIISCFPPIRCQWTHSHCRDLGMLHTSTYPQDMNTLSSVFSRLLLQLPIDLHTTLSLFISHNYNFSASDAVRAEPSQIDSAPYISFINNP